MTNVRNCEIMELITNNKCPENVMKMLLFLIKNLYIFKGPENVMKKTSSGKNYTSKVYWAKSL
jgi:ssDNA-binding Zn-finger/Zn-ribbon topoisomerase 1